MELIKEYNNVLSKELCEQLIDIFNRDPGKKEGETAGGLLKDVKNTLDLHISDSIFKEEILKIDDILVNILNNYIQQYINCFIETGIQGRRYTDEGFQIQRYEKNEGFYKYHVDELIKYDERKSRMITYIFYLNTVEIGGETEFFGTNKIKAEQGKLVLFPASWAFPHKGCMPISEDKYILTGWFYTHEKK